MIRILKYIVFILCITVFNLAFSQQQLELKIVVPEIEKPILNKYKIKNEFTDSLSRYSELTHLLVDLWNDGYITASVDSFRYDSNIMTSFVKIGNSFSWLNLKQGNAPSVLLDNISFKEKKYIGKAVSFKEIAKLNKSILTYYENNGYPFASVKLDSIDFINNEIYAVLNINKNTKIIVDSIVMKGKAKLSKKYLSAYLGIKSGDLYDESKVSNIPKKIKELQFIKEIKPLNVIFYKDKAKIILYTDKKKNSQVDGILGVLPNSETNGKLMLTGEVNLSLVNSFYRGENIEINWRKLKKATQDLKMKLVYPYFFNTPLGADIRFTLFKNDTLYLNVERDLGIRYYFTGNNYIKIFTENNSSSLLSTDAYKNSTVLPPYADIRTNLYGLGYELKKLDYYLNPRKGIDIFMSGSMGNRQIKKNIELNEIIYKDIKLKTSQYKFSALGNFYFPLFSKSTIKIGFNTAFMHNETIFENELFKIGGLKTLRGFDEESIHASFYTIATLEYRYLFEENSFLFAFWNGAYYDSKTVQKYIHDTPYGFGAGVCFETKAGIFSLTYALGKQFDNPIYLKSGKIHFGVVSYF